MVLAMQRRIDLGDDERFNVSDALTRIDYWTAITPNERDLMLLRADAVINAQNGDDDEYALPQTEAKVKDT